MTASSSSRTAKRTFKARVREAGQDWCNGVGRGYPLCCVAFYCAMIAFDLAPARRRGVIWQSTTRECFVPCPLHRHDVEWLPYPDVPPDPLRFLSPDGLRAFGWRESHSKAFRSWYAATLARSWDRSRPNQRRA